MVRPGCRSEHCSKDGKQKSHCAFLLSFFLLTLKEGKGGREGNINVWLPLVCPLLGTWPATQAGWVVNSQAGTQSTEPH